MRSILPGRPQSSRQAICTVNWDGLRLVAYISGNTVVVFNGRRELLQSISVDDTDALHSLIINEASGHIAVSDNDTVYVYQPFGRDYGDLRWTRKIALPHETEEAIEYLSWGSEEDLLVAGDRLTLWTLSDEAKPQVVWASTLSGPIAIACFSPDAGLIASCGQHDRLVKIWRRLSYEQDSTRFDVSYLPHPSTVINISWRSFWHQEQNLDNVLYTLCADNHIYVWAHSEQHAYNTMQRIITIDAGASIQPRRLSVGSLSKNRFVFMLGSRDLARAAERSLQNHPGGTDHALENFIQIVGRSPEICVIMDGLGHMSAWGIENAGLRNKLDPEKFNVALVDGVDIQLPSGRSLDDHVQIHAFANNDVSASLCIIVHSYSGQVDWYQGSFVEFFDTASRGKRTSLLSCWSGHDSTLEKMISSRGDRSFISVDEQDHAILWSKSPAGALLRRSRIQSAEAVLDACLLDEDKYLVFLHSEEVSLWDIRSISARKIGTCKLGTKDPLSVCWMGVIENTSYRLGLAVLFENGHVEQYGITSPTSKTTQLNGYHKVVELMQPTRMLAVGKDDAASFCLAAESASSQAKVLSLSDSGEVKIFGTRSLQGTELQQSNHILKTYLRTSNIVASFDGKVHAFAHSDYQTISVWNSTQAACEFVRRFDDMDLINDLYWHSTGDGQLVLAIQFPYNIVLLAQKRYSLTGQEPAWELLQIVRTRNYSTNHVDTLCWVQPCQLALGMANQILTFDVQREAKSSVPTDEDFDSLRNISVPEYLALQNASLPLFDTNVLGQLLESGHFSTVSTIFEALHEQLKFLVSGEEVDHNLHSSSAGFQPADFTNLIENSNFNEATDQTREQLTKLSEIQASLDERISKISRSQISLLQKRRLRNLITIYRQLLENQGSMDSLSLRYLYHFLSVISDSDGPINEFPPLPYSAITHASLSRTQESLTHFILSELERRNIKFTWQTARSLGIFLFTSDTEALRDHLESVAKAEYNRNAEDRNPVDCSLYYLALDKKAILQLLWRRTVGFKEKENTLKLLSRDFKDPKAKSTALKNAYALLSRRRFEYAAAFFLLGGSLVDAVNVCVNQIHDIQLGIAITRAWNGSQSVRDQAMRNLLGKDLTNAAIDTYEARWYGIWGCTFQKDFAGAIRYITQPIDQLFASQFQQRREVESEQTKKENMPFAAYDYRANEPGLLLTMYMHIRANMVEQQQWTQDMLSAANEHDFVKRCMNYYRRAGMDVLALKLVSQWETVQWQVSAKEANTLKSSIAAQATPIHKSALDEWLMPDGEMDAVLTKATQQPAQVVVVEEKVKKKPPPTQFIEPSADSLLDSFGF